MSNLNRAKKLEGRAKQRKHKIHNKGMANLHTNIAQKNAISAEKILGKIDSIRKQSERVYLKPGEHSPENSQEFAGPRGGRFYNVSGKVEHPLDFMREESQKTSNEDLNAETYAFLRSESNNWRKQSMAFKSNKEDETVAWLLNDGLDELRSNPNEKVRFIKSERGLENFCAYNEDTTKNMIYIDILTSSPQNQVGRSTRRAGGGNKLLYDVIKEGLDNGFTSVGLLTLDKAKSYYLQNGFEQYRPEGYRWNEGKLIMNKENMLKFVQNHEAKLGKDDDTEPIAVSERYFMIQKDFGVVASINTPTYGGAGINEKARINNRIKAILGKSLSSIEGEAKQVIPKTPTQKRVLGTVEQFLDKYLDEETTIQKFLGGYRKLALLSKSFSGPEFDNLLDLAKSVNNFKGYNIKLSIDADRLDKVIMIDSVAHNLHKIKFQEGHSLYKELDELASISKSIGETDRDDRLLLLQSPVYNKSKIESLGIKVLQKSSISLWGLYEKAIKVGVEKLSNKELILLREFVWSKI